MSTLAKALTAAAGNAGVADAPNVADVFSTYLYTSPNDSSTFSVNNGIDLDGEGGMVWLKSRNYNGGEHLVFDTERPNRYPLKANATQGEHNVFPQSNFTFSSTGFGITDGYGYDLCYGGYDYASWTFRKAPRFFDVVTYTGNGVAGREIAHNLGCDVGMIIVKSSSDVNHWRVYHRSLGGTKSLQLNSTSSQSTNTMWNNTNATSSVFTVDDGSVTNILNYEYVAYLFAHDPNGEDNDGMIACGSYTASSGVDAVINLGWEAQYVMIKQSSPGTANREWYITDSMRGLNHGGEGVWLTVDVGLEGSSSVYEVLPDPNGFIVPSTEHDSLHEPGMTYIYMAIRAPMMKEPEAGTEVFDTFAYTGDNTTRSLSTTLDYQDMWIAKRRTETTDFMISCRMTSKELFTNLTNIEDNYGSDFDHQGVVLAPNYWRNSSGVDYSYSAFKRAKGFFDVVAYTADGQNGRQIKHSLGVPPEMIITKARITNTSVPEYWVVSTTVPSNQNLRLDADWKGYSGLGGIGSIYNDYYIVNAVNEMNGSGGQSYIAYLFATLAGVSKVGSYTGTGGYILLNCGFSAGARFVMIKRTDASGDWYVWDTTRGITTGNDPYLLLNATDAEVTNTTYIEPNNSGFYVSFTAPDSINAVGGTYIFLAIA